MQAFSNVLAIQRYSQCSYHSPSLTYRLETLAHDAYYPAPVMGSQTVWSVWSSAHLVPAGQEERDPYWARPWPSALALGRYILERPHCAQGRTVCEVGAGLGIGSIAALLAGQPT